MPITIFIVWGVYIIFLLISSAQEIDTTFENSPVWKHMYLMLVAMQLAFCVVYVLYA
jgi:hypothetical protein